MQPLSDLRVLAVTVFLAGPFLSMTLARLGAEVIPERTAASAVEAAGKLLSFHGHALLDRPPAAAA